MFDISISGRIVDPVDEVYEATVLVRKNRIEKITEKDIKSKFHIQLSSSQMILPGFIDPHVHMREPGWEYKEDFLTGSRAALHGGVTTVGDMPNLPEPIVNKDRLVRKIKLAEKSLVDVLHLGGVGNVSGIKDLSPFVPAFKIYTAKSTGELTLGSWGPVEEATRIISKLGKPITFHCEEQDIMDKAREELKNKNYPWKHCDERPPESEITAIEKVLEICKKYRTTANIAHISTAESLGIISESRDELDLFCEATPHHLFFKKEDMEKLGSLLKINCPLRDEKDRKELVDGIRKEKIDMLATDHAPHTLEEKNSSNPPSGMPGLDTYGNFALWLMVEHKVKPQTIARVTSLNAANYLGIKDKARIKEKCIADLVVLDTKGKTKIENKSLYTKCGWSSFDGKTFPGRIVCTIKNGVIAAKDGVVL